MTIFDTHNNKRQNSYEQKDNRNEAMIKWANGLSETERKMALGIHGNKAYNAARNALGASKSKTNSNIKANTLATIITKNLGVDDKFNVPNYRKFSLNLQLHALRNSNDDVIIKEILFFIGKIMIEK